VPCEFEALPDFIGLSYEELAFEVLRRYLTDFSEDALKDYISQAYGEFLPVKLNGKYLELFHGKTFAFKDVALQLFPFFLKDALRQSGRTEDAVILAATSGDTGSAVLSGVTDVPGLRAIVFYPFGSISPMQQLQMTTHEGRNVNVFGIRGNFDEAQTAVKTVFADTEFLSEFSGKYLFTSANSINIGRLLPQIVYYFYSYSELVKSRTIKEGSPINFVVPTGNFGNILAGYYAYKMGLPINRLICASNSNCVLHEYITTGVYNANRTFNTTLSPSMDILISSNLERFIYDLNGCEVVTNVYASLKATGEFRTNRPIELFDADAATDSETLEAIKQIYDESSYILDPHTAVGQCVNNKYKRRTGDETFSVIVATASPYKFAETVENALSKPLTDWPESLLTLNNKPILHDKVIANIKDTIRETLSPL
jgi:threonine synthase